MEDIKPEDYSKLKKEYTATIQLMAKASVQDSFKSLAFANNALSLGLQAFGVDASSVVLKAMREELNKLETLREPSVLYDSDQLTMDFYPKSGEFYDRKESTRSS